MVPSRIVFVGFGLDFFYVVVVCWKDFIAPVGSV